MKLYSWNVNGIRAVVKKGTFQTFMSEHQPDILCLQETKAERGQFEIDFPQYEEHFFSAVKKGYSVVHMMTTAGKRPSPKRSTPRMKALTPARSS